LARDAGLRSNSANVHAKLRDLARQRNDFDAYIEHNNEYTRITEEIRGADAKLKIAMQAKEREIAEREKEHAKHLAVLHSTLPKHIADRVARGEVVNDQHDNVAVLFVDLVGFTTMSAEMDPSDVVLLLENIFGVCDRVMNTHNMMKIKTIGDSYMAVAFDRVESAADAALALIHEITSVPIRIGIHCGPVVAGIIGKERLQYDVWGDTVNVASRMESTSEPGRIQVSEAFARSLDAALGGMTSQGVVLTLRGDIHIKGKGPMKTYWLEGA
jgi:class 3 adenylate cyclase